MYGLGQIFVGQRGAEDRKGWTLDALETDERFHLSSDNRLLKSQPLEFSVPLITGIGNFSRFRSNRHTIIYRKWASRVGRARFRSDPDETELFR